MVSETISKQLKLRKLFIALKGNLFLKMSNLRKFEIIKITCFTVAVLIYSKPPLTAVQQSITLHLQHLLSVYLNFIMTNQYYTVIPQPFSTYPKLYFI